MDWATTHLTGGEASDILAGDDGNDTLLGPAVDTVWEITAPDGGTLNTLTEFNGIENLSGGANNQDGFVFFTGGSISGTVDGGAGGSDGIIVEDPAEEGPFTVVNPHSSGDGTLSLYGHTVNYAGMEPIVDASTPGTVLVHGSSYDDDLVLEDSDPATPGRMQVRSASGDFFNAGSGSLVAALSFDNPTAALIVRLGAGEDSLTMASLDPSFTAPVSFEGGNGYDTLVGLDATNTWTISGDNAGALNSQVNYSGVENLTGGNGQDDFLFSEGADLDGIIDGGSDGFDTVDFSGAVSGVTVDMTRDVNRVDMIKGGGGSDTLIALPDSTTWNITSMGGGQVVVTNDEDTVIANVGFSGFENLKGLEGDDTFVFSDGMGMSGTIDGGGGANTLDYHLYATNDVTVNLGSGATTGASGVGSIQNIIGGGGNDDVLVGPDVGAAWNITGADSGQLENVIFANGQSGDVQFTGFENLTGAPDNDDRFVFKIGGSISGTASGGTGRRDSLAIENPDTPGNFAAINPDATGTGVINVSQLFPSHTGSISYAELEPSFEVNPASPDKIEIWFIPFSASAVETGPSAGQFQIRGLDSTTAVWSAATGTWVNTTQAFDVPSGSLALIAIEGSLAIGPLVLPGADLNISGNTVSLVGNITSSGGNLAVAANSITVNQGVVISTRKTEGGDQGTAPSVGDSGNLTFIGKTITVESGAKLLSFDDRTSEPGAIGIAAGIDNQSWATGEQMWTPGAVYNDIETTASASGTGLTVDVVVDNEGRPTVYLHTRGTGYADDEVVTIADPDAIGGGITVLVDGLLGGGGDITLEGTHHTYSHTFAEATATAGININGATLKGRAVTVRADADNDVYFDDEMTKVELVGESALDFLGNLRLFGCKCIATSTASILVGSGTVIDADADVVLDAHANSEANAFTLGLGVGGAYARTEATATLKVQAGASIDAAGSVFMRTQTDNAVSVSVFTKLIGAIPLHVAVAVTEAYSHATTTVENGAVITAGGDIDVQAIGQKKLSSAASGGGDKDYFCAAVVVALSDATADAVLDGQATSTGGDVSVIAQATSLKNVTRAQSISGNTLFAKLPGWVSETTLLKGLTELADVTGITGFIKGMFKGAIGAIKERYFGKSEDPLELNKFTISAGVSVGVHNNRASASIGSNAVVDSGGNVEVRGNALDRPDITAVSIIGASTDKLKKKNPEEPGGDPTQIIHRSWTLGVAVPVGHYTNQSFATIGSGAVVDAQGTIEVKSDTSLPYDPIWEKIKRLYVDTGAEFKNIIQAAALADIGANSFVSSWGLSMAEGKVLGAAGSVNLVYVNNTSSALIGAGARINQSDLITNPGNVAVTARTGLKWPTWWGTSPACRQKVKIDDIEGGRDQDGGNPQPEGQHGGRRRFLRRLLPYQHHYGNYRVGRPGENRQLAGGRSSRHEKLFLRGGGGIPRVGG